METLEKGNGSSTSGSRTFDDKYYYEYDGKVVLLEQSNRRYGGCYIKDTTFFFLLFLETVTVAKYRWIHGNHNHHTVVVLGRQWRRNNHTC